MPKAATKLSPGKTSSECLLAAQGIVAATRSLAPPSERAQASEPVRPSIMTALRSPSSAPVTRERPYLRPCLASSVPALGLSCPPAAGKSCIARISAVSTYSSESSWNGCLHAFKRRHDPPFGLNSWNGARRSQAPRGPSTHLLESRHGSAAICSSGVLYVLAPLSSFMNKNTQSLFSSAVRLNENTTFPCPQG